MKILEERILQDGKALNEDVLKVDSFLNHQVDVKLMEQIGKEFAEHFKDKEITKVITIESSGIAPAMMTAKELNTKLVIFKKKKSKILSEDLYQTQVMSFTKGEEYTLTVSKKYINPEDKILIIDDFLANGEACNGVIRLIKEAGADIAVCGTAIVNSNNIKETIKELKK